MFGLRLGNTAVLQDHWLMLTAVKLIKKLLKSPLI